MKIESDEHTKFFDQEFKSQFSDIMISYDRREAKNVLDKVKNIYKKLSNAYDVRTSVTKYRKINNEYNLINDSSLIILILTKNYFTEDSCAYEFTNTRNLQKPTIVIDIDCLERNKEKLKSVKIIEHIKLTEDADRLDVLLDEMIKDRELKFNNHSRTLRKRFIFSILGFITIIVAIVLIPYLLLRQRPKCSKSDTEIVGNQSDYRFSFNISKSEHFFYIGNKMWIFQNFSRQQEFIEVERNNQGVIVQDSNAKMVYLSTLCKINNIKTQPKWKKPNWQSVWNSNDGEMFFYPKDVDIWFQRLNEKLNARYILLSKNGTTVILVEEHGDYRIKLNNSGMYEGSVENSLRFISLGKWIHLI